MWRVIAILVVLGLLSGCSETPERSAERKARQLNADASALVRFRCVDGYLFVERQAYEGVGLAQFWETGADGQPRPRVCGGE